MQTEKAIKLVKDTFESELAAMLELTRVSAPLFVRPETGLNDDLNGVERPVDFDIRDIGAEVEVVHSLAKWKRLALKRYGFKPETGLYTDMNAIRRDEELDNLHSVYVDQWDWEKVILPEDRNLHFLKSTVRDILSALVATQKKLCARFEQLDCYLPQEVHFVSSQELEDLYPELDPKERENAICKRHGVVFITQIGGKLHSGKPHDGRAPDYDDWELNGDLLVWYPVLQRAIEISSMGIRVDAAALDRQLRLAGCEERSALPFHKMLLNNELPLTMGGGIGQSRLCMLLLQKAHIGEVQASVWPDDMLAACEANGIHLL
ncbi:aspartate--ammonia ligase [Clostridiaceae bacterium NSJ-31]|uniref:Aspartate--ammonia ligase n=1 Tax=Ligaoa zhengdingensis TaxID=2763658 RepID=A0A926I5F4_9FIRM|nr:aspartate--ammonia ligase [Ligaoa zhengdingensis]MBC8547415.1 aspartate--ammonia ligase [Ligaoa zhengdingensis]